MVSMFVSALLAARLRTARIASGWMSSAYTFPEAPTCSAAAMEYPPGPQPKSKTTDPGRMPTSAKVFPGGENRSRSLNSMAMPRNRRGSIGLAMLLSSGLGTRRPGPPLAGRDGARGGPLAEGRHLLGPDHREGGGGL